MNTQADIDMICKQRGLPKIKKGSRCEVDGRPGKIVGINHSANFNVVFEGEKHKTNCHPYYLMKIWDKAGEVIYVSDDLKAKEGKA